MSSLGPIIPVFNAGRARLLTFDARAVDPTQIGFPELLAWIADREPRAIGNWRELSAQEYTRSFAVAQTAGYSVIREIYDALTMSFANGETAEEFAARLIPFLRGRGWIASPGQAAKRLELIYDTNLRVARGAGRWARIKRTAHVFPYLRGVTARDERVRHPPKSTRAKSTSDHRAFDGLILPVSHPFWSRWFVPLGFRCRCSVIQMSRSQLLRWPGGVTGDDELREREARLGDPVFASPGSFDAQLAQVAGIANEARIPGQPALDMTTARITGNALLQQTLLEQGLDELATVLNRIFGIAA